MYFLSKIANSIIHEMIECVVIIFIIIVMILSRRNKGGGERDREGLLHP